MGFGFASFLKCIHFDCVSHKGHEEHQERSPDYKDFVAFVFFVGNSLLTQNQTLSLLLVN